MGELRSLRDAFEASPQEAAAAYLGSAFTSDAVVLHAGRSSFDTPVIEVTDPPGKELLAVFVLPYGPGIATSFKIVRRIRPRQRVRLTGRLRLFAEESRVLVFKDSRIVEAE